MSSVVATRPRRSPTTDARRAPAAEPAAHHLTAKAGAAGATLVAGTTGAYLVLAVLVVAAVTPFVLRSMDRPLRRGHLPPTRVPDFLRGFWISPRQHPDFAWAWATRFLATIANSICTMYLLFFLTDAVRVDDPELGVLVLTLLYAACLIVSAIVAGIWSDRIGLRKPFVTASGVVMSSAAVLLAIVQTWSAALVGEPCWSATTRKWGLVAATRSIVFTKLLPCAETTQAVRTIAWRAPEVRTASSPPSFEAP